MASRRCTQCSRNWPNDTKYSKCPVDDAATWYSQEAAMSQSEANNEYFEYRYWPDWDRARLAGERKELVTVDVPELAPDIGFTD